MNLEVDLKSNFVRLKCLLNQKFIDFIPETEDKIMAILKYFTTKF